MKAENERDISEHQRWKGSVQDKTGDFDTHKKLKLHKPNTEPGEMLESTHDEKWLIA